MNERSDMPRVLRHWFDEGPSTMPDRVVDLVADRIGRQRQRPARRLDWRPASMSLNIRIAAAVAAVAALGLIGATLLGQLPRESIASQRPSTTGLPAIPATPSPSATVSQPPLQSGGAVVFEHNWPLGRGPHTRIEYLLPDLRGEVLLPGFELEQLTPTWSPDGTRLAFSAWDSNAGGPEQLWETDASGTEPRLLTTGCEPPACIEEKNPGYSPDGASVVFIRLAGTPGDAPVSSVVAIRDLATGEVTELASTRTAIVGEDGRFADLAHPRWSPDGTTILFHVLVRDAAEQPVDGGVRLVDVDGTNLRRLSPEGIPAADAEWSPDGSTIVFAAKAIHDWPCCAWDGHHIYTIGVDGANLRQLDAEGAVGSPTWTADGNQILYVISHEATVSAQDILVMDRDGANPRIVAHFTDCCRWYPAQQPTP